MKSSSSPALLDRRVLITMMLFAAVAVIGLGFRFYSEEPCKPIAISVVKSSFHTNELVRLKAEIKGEGFKKLTWDFGDKTVAVENESIVTHTYPEPGKYVITLIVDNGCSESKTITVSRAPEPDTNTKLVISGPSKAFVGDMVTFTDATPNGFKWEWWFGENNSLSADATTQRASYTYQQPGQKKVILLVNGKMQGEWLVLIEAKADYRRRLPNGKNTQGRIISKEGPTKPPVGTQIQKGDTTDKVNKNGTSSTVESTKHDVITEDEIVNRLKQFIDGGNIPDSFLKHAQDITINFRGKSISFNQLCNELRRFFEKNSWNIKIITLKDIEKGENNLITSMTVQADRKGFIRRKLKL